MEIIHNSINRSISIDRFPRKVEEEKDLEEIASVNRFHAILVGPD